MLNTIFVPNEAGDLIAVDDALPLLQNAPEIAPGDYGAAFVKMFLTLMVLIALFGFSIWFVKRLIRQRLERGSDDQSIQILEKRMISPKTTLYLVEAEGKKVLFAESQLEVRVLSQTTPTTLESLSDPQG